MTEADELRMVLADIVLSAVLHPANHGYEIVKREVVDQARFYLDRHDIAAAADRARAMQPGLQR